MAYCATIDELLVLPANIHGGYSPPSSDMRERRSSAQRLSPYFFLPTGSHSHSSGGSSSHSPPMSVHNMYHAAPNFYYPSPDYPISPNSMWHLKRYSEDEIPNMSPSMAAAALYPQLQGVVQQSANAQMSNRRYSIASVSSANYSQSQQSQRRRISVSKFQNIPPANYLQVPSFHEYDHKRRYNSKKSQQRVEHPATFDYMKYTNQTTPPSHSKAAFVPPTRRYSSGHIPSSAQTRMSKSMSRESSRSASSDDSPKTSNDRSRSTSLERIPTPDPTNAPAPAFEFTSNHLPLRPPTIDVNKVSSGSGSGSASTPESQRIESRQMIPTSSKGPYSAMDEIRKEAKKESKGNGDRSIFSISKPAKWCRHAEGKTCASCNNAKGDAASVCSSVGPPPTFTALDNYQPVRKRSRFTCSCSAIFSITVMIAVLVMVFIAGFILYVEMVLKHQTANVMDKM